jgi:exosortase H (IPTLxxWG-CTERM-specific)
LTKPPFGVIFPRRLYRIITLFVMGKKRKKKAPQQKAKSKAGKKLLRFYIVFGVLILIIGVLYPIGCVAFSEPLLKFASFTATVIGGVLKGFGSSVTVSGRYISSRGFSVEIIFPCLGIVEALYFTAAVVAFPSDLKKKLQGILIFFPVIFAANIVRCALLFMAGEHSTDAFNFVHTYFFQITMILFIAIFWLVWIKKVVRHEGKPA